MVSAMTMESFAQGIKSWLFPIVRFVDRITWITLFGMMIMTMTDVLLRKFTNFSILGSVELTELMMVVIVFCSLAQCEADDGHIKVDLIYKRFSPRIRAVLDITTQFLCCVLFCVMAWALYLQAVDMKEWGEVTIDLNWPVYPFVYVASFGCILLALVLFFKFLVALSEVSTA
jgi:TRAP-type C4-dicarboxylate transport system permease small subunit